MTEETQDYERRLRDLLGDEGEALLAEAEDKAQELGIFERRVKYYGGETIKAALTLAIAVWDVDAGRKRS